LRKKVWNESQGRFEPGEVVWSVPCHVEQREDGCRLTFDEEKEIPVGDWFLVFPWQGQLAAEHLESKTDMTAGSCGWNSAVFTRHAHFCEACGSASELLGRVQVSVARPRGEIDKRKVVVTYRERLGCGHVQDVTRVEIREVF